MERRTRYDAELATMPPGLKRAVLRVITPYGFAMPISRGELVAKTAMMGFQASERQVRETIKTLRRDGHLICSTPGNDGGYYMARSRQEYEDFRAAEYAAKIADMAETMRAMDAAARAQFGDGVQLGIPGL